MPYKDANKRRENQRKWIKNKRNKSKSTDVYPLPSCSESTDVYPLPSSCETPILDSGIRNVPRTEPLPSPSKNNRFTSYNNNFREKLRLIEDQNKLRLRQLADGSIQWKITVSDGVDYVDTTPYMPLSYL